MPRENTRGGLAGLILRKKTYSTFSDFILCPDGRSTRGLVPTSCESPHQRGKGLASYSPSGHPFVTKRVRREEDLSRSFAGASAHPEVCYCPKQTIIPYSTMRGSASRVTVFAIQYTWNIERKSSARKIFHCTKNKGDT